MPSLTLDGHFWHSSKVLTASLLSFLPFLQFFCLFFPWPPNSSLHFLLLPPSSSEAVTLSVGLSSEQSLQYFTRTLSISLAAPASNALHSQYTQITQCSKKVLSICLSLFRLSLMWFIYIASKCLGRTESTEDPDTNNTVKMAIAQPCYRESPGKMLRVMYITCLNTFSPLKLEDCV